jgi:hypothetical protein
MARQNENDLALRRVAVQLVAQLPENETEALKVLDLARAFVLHFLSSAPAGEGATIPFVRKR